MEVGSVVEQMLEPLALCLDPESARRVAEFGLSPDLQARLDKLAGRANEGLLSADERNDYEAFVSIADVISVLKLRARNRLTTHSGR
jgi:hypothetical protein